MSLVLWISCLGGGDFLCSHRQRKIAPLCLCVCPGLSTLNHGGYPHVTPMGIWRGQIDLKLLNYCIFFVSWVKREGSNCGHLWWGVGRGRRTRVRWGVWPQWIDKHEWPCCGRAHQSEDRSSPVRMGSFSCKGTLPPDELRRPLVSGFCWLRGLRWSKNASP